MANLTRTHRWARYVPDLGDNRELERPFFLRVASGLTLEELAAFEQQLVDLGMIGGEGVATFANRLAAWLQPYVLMGEEPLSVKGQPVASLAEYLALTLSVAGHDALIELFTVVRDYNSVGPKAQLFSGPPSGGNGTTALPPARGDERAIAS